MLSCRNAPIKSKLQHPPGNPGRLTIFCARGVVNLTGRPSRSGKFDLCLGGAGKIEPEVSGFKCFFSCAEVTNSYKHVFGRDRSLNEEIKHL